MAVKSTSRNKLAKLLLDVRYGRINLVKGEATEDLVFTARTVIALIRASQRSAPKSRIMIAGTIRGDLLIKSSIGGSLWILGSIKGNFSIKGAVGGSLNILGRITKNVSINGAVNGGLGIRDSGSVGGNLSVKGVLGGGIYIMREGSVDGDFSVPGSVGGDLYIWDSGSVGGDLSIRGSVVGDIYISGLVGGGFSLNGSINGQVDLLKANCLDIKSLSGALFMRPVYFGDGVNLQNCDFRAFSGFEQLRFVGSKLFGSGAKRIRHTQNGERIKDVELTSIYRQLRQVYERQSNRPEAGDFYYQEMNARLRASWKSSKAIPQGFVLLAYWLISGYSQKAWRASGWFVGVAVGSTWLFLRSDLMAMSVEVVDGDAVETWQPAGLTETLQFSVQSMVSFFSPPKGDLDEQGRWYQLTLRFIGPTILAQLILAIREKVAR